MADDARPAQRWDPGARYRPSQLAAATSSRLVGRLHRGPAARTAVFDRQMWYRGVTGTRVSALDGAVVAYQHGVVDTSGLLRVLGRVLR